ELGDGVEAQLVDDTARQAVARQDVVLCPQIVIGYGLQLIKLLNGRDVRVFFLNLQHHLSAIGRLLLQRCDGNHYKDNEENRQDRRQAPANDVSAVAKVNPFFRPDDLIRVRQLDDASFQASSLAG